MVTCKLYGRLGNQAFQLAVTIAYAKRHGLSYGIPQEISCPPGVATDPIYFTKFPLPAPTTEHTLIFTYREHPSQCYTPLPPPPDREGCRIVLDGYFQSEKYFADQREAVLHAFNLRTLTISDGPVSLHVRRGDYLLKQDCHPVIDIGYYAEAMRFFKEKGTTAFIVFSDDMTWCMQNLPAILPMKCRLIYCFNQSALEDLESMSVCAGNIIANSSFSWWGAWLNQNPDKIVVAPKTWFGPALSHIDTKDLLPEKWIKL